jgi:hypothetical protein
MTLNIRIPTPSAGDEACKSVKRIYADIANYIAHGLGEIVAILNDKTIATEFWQQQETDGVANLIAFGKARDLLQEIAPDLVSAELAAAGSTLVANQDGTVTVPAE